MSDVEMDYYCWLCDLVEIDQDDNSWRNLAAALHRIPFYSIVEHDENRAMDGLELREEYLRKHGYSEEDNDLIEGDCTVFEMIIGLARKMEYETANPYDLNEDEIGNMRDWFWELIQNLGLKIFDDFNYVDLDGDEEVDDIIYRLLEREYAPSGVGGLFPLRHWEEDQRNVELWYQMSAYLNEMGE